MSTAIPYNHIARRQRSRKPWNERKLNFSQHNNTLWMRAKCPYFVIPQTVLDDPRLIDNQGDSLLESLCDDILWEILDDVAAGWLQCTDLLMLFLSSKSMALRIYHKFRYYNPSTFDYFCNTYDSRPETLFRFHMVPSVLQERRACTIHDTETETIHLANPLLYKKIMLGLNECVTETVKEISAC